jgi:hypothetical protein
MDVEIREAEYLHQVDGLAAVKLERVPKLSGSGLFSDLIDLGRYEQAFAEVGLIDDASERSIVRGVSGPGVDELAATVDEGSKNLTQRIIAARYDFLDYLARAQADHGQHLPGARNTPDRHRALAE